MNALTQKEISDFEQLEKVVSKGQKTFVEVGLALNEIRERELFRKDYKTFEAYCQGRWGWSRQRGHQLIQASEVVKALPPSLSTAVDNEAVARELKKLPVPVQKQVLKEAQKSGEPLTAPEVRKHLPPPPVVKPKKSPPPPPPAKKTPPVPTSKSASVPDKTGWPIPEKLLQMWERSHEVQEILTSLSRIKGALRTAQEGKDKLFAEVNFSSALAQLDQAYSDIKTAIPYAVCPTCQGKTLDNCALCKGRGFISEHRWTTVVPKETKEIRFKANK